MTLQAALRGRCPAAGRPLASWHLSLFLQWMQNMLGQVLDALEYLHQLDIVHR